MLHNAIRVYSHGYTFLYIYIHIYTYIYVHTTYIIYRYICSFLWPTPELISMSLRRGDPGLPSRNWSRLGQGKSDALSGEKKISQVI